MSTLKNAASSSSDLHEWKYDVFVSFRGEDLRGGFMSHFFTALEQQRINCFRDNAVKDVGRPVESKIFEAIRHSKIGLAVFSQNYADSKWCLDELAEILECYKNFGDQYRFIPMFFKVETGDVGKQRGDFGKGLLRLKNSPNIKGEQIMRWEKALADAGKISGLSLKNNGDESQFIKIIVGQLCGFLGKQYSDSTEIDELSARRAAHDRAVEIATAKHHEAVRKQTAEHHAAVARQARENERYREAVENGRWFESN